MNPELQDILDGLTDERVVDMLNLCAEATDRLRKTTTYRHIKETPNAIQAVVAALMHTHPHMRPEDTWAASLVAMILHKDPDLIRTNLVAYMIAQENGLLYVTDDRVRLLLIYVHLCAIAKFIP